MKTAIEYIFSKSFYSDIIVDLGLGGIIIELLLLSLFVPLIIWIKNRKKNKLNKFHAITILYGLFNEILDQFIILLEFDKIESERGDNVSPTLRYYLKNGNDIKVGYMNSYYYGELKPKLFCIEHFCQKHSEPKINNALIIDSKKSLKSIISRSNQIHLSNINDGGLNSEINILKSMLIELSELLRNFQKEPKKAINGLHALSFLMLELFYKYVDFYEDYFINLESEKKPENEDLSQKEFMNKIYRIEKKHSSKSEFRSELSSLMRIVTKKFKL